MTKAVHPWGVLLRPVITEKSTLLSEQGKYVFAIAIRANKLQVKEAVQLAYKVSVTDVNVMKVHGKTKRVGRTRGKAPDWKKAIVTVQPGDRIELFEGV